MKMDTQIRVKTDRRYGKLYNQMKNVALGEMHELFFLCACLGYRAGRHKSLGKSGEDKFWSVTITPEEWCSFYAMVLEERGMDFAAVQDDNAVIARMEEYANAGMEVLIENVLKDYLAGSGGQEEVSLNETASKDLAKVLLSYIFVEAYAESG